MSDTVHTGVEVCKIDLEMCGLIKIAESGLNFLGLRLGLEWQDHAVTQQVTSGGGKSHDKWKEWYYIMCDIHGHLG